jgi:hypothetical protein
MLAEPMLVIEVLVFIRAWNTPGAGRTLNERDRRDRLWLTGCLIR